MDENYVLTKNLDFADAASYASNAVNTEYRPTGGDPSMATNAGWAPIGDNSTTSDATRFTGSFDGGGFTISNLYVNISSADAVYAGLFGITGAGSKVQNLGMVNAYVKAEGTGSGTAYAGGLVGVNGGTIGDSYATGSATATGSGGVFAGGLLGYNNHSGTISNSYATGQVTGRATSSHWLYAGGLVGYNNAAISNSYATGEVTATGSGTTVFVGGLLGGNSGPIENSYATGNVTVTASAVYAGGLVGTQHNSTVRNSYATGNITAIDSYHTITGGLLGETRGSVEN